MVWDHQDEKQDVGYQKTKQGGLDPEHVDDADIWVYLGMSKLRMSKDSFSQNIK